MNIAKQQALMFLAQMGTDFLGMLPVSARLPVKRELDAALAIVQQPDEPESTRDPQG